MTCNERGAVKWPENNEPPGYSVIINANKYTTNQPTHSLYTVCYCMCFTLIALLLGLLQRASPTNQQEEPVEDAMRLLCHLLRLRLNTNSSQFQTTNNFFHRHKVLLRQSFCLHNMHDYTSEKMISMLKSNQFRETDDISGLKLTMTVGQKKRVGRKINLYSQFPFFNKRTKLSI